MQIGSSTEICLLASKLLCILNCLGDLNKVAGVVCRYVHYEHWMQYVV